MAQLAAEQRQAPGFAEGGHVAEMGDLTGKESGRRCPEAEAHRVSVELKWLWVKNRYPKLKPGRWQHGPKPAVPWWFNFDPHPNRLNLLDSS